MPWREGTGLCLDQETKKLLSVSGPGFLFCRIFFFSRIFFLEGDGDERMEREKDVVMEKTLDVIIEKTRWRRKLPCRHRSVRRAPRDGLLLLQREVAPAADQLLAWTPRSPRRPAR